MAVAARSYDLYLQMLYCFAEGRPYPQALNARIKVFKVQGYNPVHQILRKFKAVRHVAWP